jgi:hypothetical protein
LSTQTCTNSNRLKEAQLPSHGSDASAYRKFSVHHQPQGGKFKAANDLHGWSYATRRYPEHSPSYSLIASSMRVPLSVLFHAPSAGTRSFAHSTAMRAKVKEKSAVSFRNKADAFCIGERINRTPDTMLLEMHDSGDNRYLERIANR